MGTDTLPYKYKGLRLIETHPVEQINSLPLQTLNLFQPQHVAVRLLISTTRDGVLMLAGQPRARPAMFTP